MISFLFLSYLGMNPIELSKYYGARFGSAVGMSVGVTENPVNKLAMELKQKEDSLRTKELELAQRAAVIDKKPEQDKMIINFMGAGIIVLFILIITNFILDRRFRKKNKEAELRDSKK